MKILFSLVLTIVATSLLQAQEGRMREQIRIDALNEPFEEFVICEHTL